MESAGESDRPALVKIKEPRRGGFQLPPTNPSAQSPRQLKSGEGQMLTAKQIERRRHHIGSSDIAAICGLSPWENAGDVYAAKVQKLDPLPTNENMEIGNLAEGGLLDWAAKETGYKIRKNQYRVCKSHPLCACQHDALEDTHTVGFEAKATGVKNPFFKDIFWGEENTGQVPDYVYCQTQFQMFVSDLERVYIPALIGGRGIVMFSVKRSDNVIDEIVERGLAFWNGHVLPRVPPPDVPPAMETRKRTDSRSAKVLRDEAQAQVIALLDDAEGARLPNGDSITYMGHDRTTFKSKEFKAEHPDEYKKYSETKQVRRLTFRKE